MSADELEKYLNSLILCTEYYYKNDLYIYLKKLPKTSNTEFIKNPDFNEIIEFSHQNKSLNCIKQHLTTILEDSSQNTINYFVINLQNILIEYITKNQLPSIEVDYIVGEYAIDGWGKK